MSDFRQREQITRPRLTEAWTEDFLTPLVGELHRAYGQEVSGSAVLSSIRHRLSELHASTVPPENPDQQRTVQTKEEVALRAKASSDLILVCLAMLEGHTRRREEPPMAANLPPDQASRQMDELHSFYGDDFQTVMQATQTRHSLLQNLDLNVEDLAKTADAIYEVASKLIPGIRASDQRTKPNGAPPKSIARQGRGTAGRKRQ